jgi:ABC-type molybdate transport system substrate-binding protein
MTTLRFTLSLFSILWLACAVPGWADDSEITALTVLADPVLAIPLTQLASEYSAKQHVSINVTYTPSFEQLMAIESGEKTDLLITAHPPTLNKLKRQHKIEGNAFEALAHMKLALIAPATATPKKTKGIALIRNLFQSQRKLLAIAIPATSSEGYYTSIALNLWRHRYGIFLESSTVQMQNSNEIAEFVAQKKGYGLIFTPEASQHNGIRILENFAVMKSGIALNAAVLKSNNTKASKKFLEFLRENRAQRLFMQHGFAPAASPN